MKITKAIIPVAGYGTRRLPITKAIEKCMLPIGNRPVVDYLVEDCIKAGAKDIYFVINPTESSQIKAYYDRNKDFEQYLTERGKSDKLSQLQTAPADINFHYVVQENYDKYGTAVPIYYVMKQYNLDEPVMIVYGDAFFNKPAGGSEMANVIKTITDDAEGAVLGIRTPRDELYKFGVFDITDDGLLKTIVEKPSPEEAPSDIINSGNYIAPPKMLKMAYEFVANNEFGPDKEYYLTDVANEFVEQGGVMRVMPNTGEFLDGGSLEGWLHANEVIAKDL